MTRPSTALPAPTLPTVRAVVSKKQPSHRSVRVVSVRLEESMIERLDALVERTGRTRGFYLRLVLRQASFALLMVLARVMTFRNVGSVVWVLRRAM